MGLFRKKPKATIEQQTADRAEAEEAQMDRLEALLPRLEERPEPVGLEGTGSGFGPSPRPPKPSRKSKRDTVSTAEFLALRAELGDMKTRLDESEHARAVVEARLGALDAAAVAFSSEHTDVSEVAGMVLELQRQVAEHGTGNGVTTTTDAAALPPPPPTVSGPDPETLERLAEVQQRVNDLDHIRHRIGDIDRLSQRIGELDHLHQRVAGVETLHHKLGELDSVEQRLTTIDGLADQFQQLDARVAAQAELGAQLSLLHERINELAEQPRGADDDVRLQLQEIGERLSVTEALQDHVGQLAERVSVNDAEARAVREHVTLLDQRLTNVGTELANQLSELGSDIDGLGQRIPEVADGAASDELADALRGGQVRLAKEQARYEIAFRQDLAALAEQLRRERADS